MWSDTCSLAAKARDEGRPAEAASLYRLAAMEARSEGFKIIPLTLERSAQLMDARVVR